MPYVVAPATAQYVTTSCRDCLAELTVPLTLFDSSTCVYCWQLDRACEPRRPFFWT